MQEFVIEKITSSPLNRSRKSCYESISRPFELISFKEILLRFLVESQVGARHVYSINMHVVNGQTCSICRLAQNIYVIQKKADVKTWRSYPNWETQMATVLYRYWNERKMQKNEDISVVDRVDQYTTEVWSKYWYINIDQFVAFQLSSYNRDSDLICLY